MLVSPSQLIESAYGHVDRWRRPFRNRHFLVLPQYGVAYGRIPKAANSSVKHAIADALGIRGPGLNRDRFWASLDPNQAQLVTAAELEQHWASAYVFTFVRNPFSRLVSCYADKILERSEIPLTFRRYGCHRGMSFDEFVRAVVRVSDLRADNHFRAQWSLLSRNGRLLPQFVGQVETAKRDWKRLRARLEKEHGLALGELRHRNRTKAAKQNLATYYQNPETVQLVRTRYEKDFQYFYPNEADPK